MHRAAAVRPSPPLRTPGLPPASADPPGCVTGIEIQWLFETPLVRLNRWRCHERAGGVTRERQQYWRVIGFVHDGAYELRTPRGTGLVDLLNVAFINPFEPYTTTHPCGLGDRGSGLIVKEDLFLEIVAACDPRAAEPGSLALRPSAPCRSAIVRRQRSLLRTVETGRWSDTFAIEEEILSLADAIVAAAVAPPGAGPAPSPRSRHRDLAEETKWILGRDFRGPLRLADVAGSAGVTPSHLCRVFRAVTGVTIHRYLNGLRLRASLEALAEGERDLTRLAFDLGYSSHSHFTFAFRREFGTSPSRFRESRPLRPGARI
jgi:AraC family transcriptional regulator